MCQSVFPNTTIEETVFTPSYVRAPLLNINWWKRRGFVSGCSILFHWSMCLFFGQYQTVLITVTLYHFSPLNVIWHSGKSTQYSSSPLSTEHTVWRNPPPSGWLFKPQIALNPIYTTFLYLWYSLIYKLHNFTDFIFTVDDLSK